jgi:hypothetical protein
MRFLITGVSGFVGRTLSAEAVLRGVAVGVLRAPGMICQQMVPTSSFPA